MPRTADVFWGLVVLGCVVGFAEAGDAGAKAAKAASTKAMKEVDQLVVQGRSKYSEAVDLLSTLLTSDPDNQKALFKRAEVLELLKQHKKALLDLNRLVEVNPDSKVAYQLRSKILTRQGSFAEAEKDWAKLSAIYAASKSKHERVKKLSEAQANHRTISDLAGKQAWLNDILEREPAKPENLKHCVQMMTLFMEEAKDAGDALRMKKIECAMKIKDYDTVNHELSRILTMQPQNLNAMHMKALSLKAMGATAAAISQLKRCLSLDPEHAACKALHKSIKTYDRITVRLEAHITAQQWREVLRVIDESLAHESDPHNLDRLLHMRCKSHKETANIPKGKESCAAAVEASGESNPATWELYVLHAEVLMIAGELEELSEAQELLNKASELNRNEQTIHRCSHRLQVLIKRANTKDHYKVLSVARTCTDKEIKKAYRTLAMSHHPDKLSGSLSEKEREEAELKYRDISVAYQILSDSEKRRRYDAGEDVDDNPEQQQRRGSPFGHHGFQGGGGHYQYRWG